jgi:RNA polymerase sigma factor (sigma-70 family)
MAASSMKVALQHVYRAILVRDGIGGLTDGQLLEMFLKKSDDAAFEALLRRHGPMVLEVCRRLLPNETDAEDAFQSTFLVFVRKASSVFPREMVANWLFGVARLTALKLKASVAKRSRRERQVSDMPEPESMPVKTDGELHSLIERELSRLPERYRAPLILCDLEGRTRKEAARQLGWPEGSLSSRLSRARAMLAKRLARYGLAESAGSVALCFEHGSTSPSVPAPLIVSTLEASKPLAAGHAAPAGLVSAKVAALTKKVLYTLLAGELKKSFSVLCLAGFIITGAGWSARSIMAGGKATVLQTEAISRTDASETIDLNSTEKAALSIDVSARDGSVLAHGSMVQSKKVNAEGNRIILYTEGSTRALFVDGKGTQLAKLATQEGEGMHTSTGPQKMYIASGPVQIDKTNADASGPGVVHLQSGSHRISATGTARSEAVNQLEFSAIDNRLFAVGTLRGTKFEADADRVFWDYDKKLLMLESKNESVVRMKRRPDKEWEALRASKVFLWLDNREISFKTEGSTRQ